MNAYEQKRQRRIERLEKASKLYLEMSNKLNDQARKMCGVIPFGQPILVGHHSESRDRNYRERINRRFEKSWQLQEKSEYYAKRAASARSNNSISSDDPEAVFKIQEKIANLEQLQQVMKTVNAIIRKYDLTTPEAKTACVDHLTKGLLSLKNAAKIVEPDFCGRIGFPSYALTNNNANINRLKKRLEELTKRAGRETIEKVYGDIRVVENVEENRFQIFFPGKPSDEMRSKLKSMGFRWSLLNGCWQSFLNNQAQYALERLGIIEIAAQVNS